MPSRSKSSVTNTPVTTGALALVPRAGSSRDANEKSKVSGILDGHFNRSLEERIRERAYELYLCRGCQDGAAERDWLEAELELLADR